MNNQKIIEMIQKTESATFRIDGLGETTILTKELEFLVDAHEKQIPKRPLGIENDNRYGCVMECFECKTILSESEERPLYCPECGQKIDWS